MEPDGGIVTSREATFQFFLVPALFMYLRPYDGDAECCHVLSYYILLFYILIGVCLYFI